MFESLILLAEDTPPPAKGPGLDMLFLFLPVLVLFYFIVLRPMKRQEQERNSLLTQLKKNDKVLTTAGIYGTVVAISDKEDEITVRVDDNVRLRMIKASIARNITNEEALKAQKAAKDGKETKEGAA